MIAFLVVVGEHFNLWHVNKGQLYSLPTTTYFSVLITKQEKFSSKTSFPPRMFHRIWYSLYCCDVFR